MTTAALAPSVEAVVPVRGDGAAIHLVRRDDKTLGASQGRALCGAQGKFSARHVAYRWTRVGAPGRVHCQHCWSVAIKRKARVVWG